LHQAQRELREKLPTELGRKLVENSERLGKRQEKHRRELVKTPRKTLNDTRQTTYNTAHTKTWN
ncbi:hypothetical protein OS493_039267, partial [Desmophyllum pertusum]